jgi:hypothetical protein
MIKGDAVEIFWMLLQLVISTAIAYAYFRFSHDSTLTIAVWSAFWLGVLSRRWGDKRR